MWDNLWGCGFACENEGWVSIVQLSPTCGQTRGEIRQLKLSIALTLNVTKLLT